MGVRNIDGASTGDMTNNVTDYSIDSLSTDGSTGSGETTFQGEYSKWNGYYKTISVLKSIIDRKAMWTVGKGFETDEKTKKILDRIRGFGKDTFNSIMFNAVVTYTVGGDFFAEIIRDKAGRLTNLKPLNPESIRIVVNDNGIIKRYEQTDRNKKVVATFKVDEIFHLAKDRTADEIHGTSTIEKLESTILSYEEAKNDLKKVFHRYVKPIHVFKLDTDDPSEIATFKAKADAAVENGENMFIPKDAVEMERVSIPQFSTLDPIPWIQELEKLMIMSEGVPAIVLGSGTGNSEATGKILYLAFQQMVEWNQLFLEEQLKAQLGVEVEFEFPASIEPELMQDTKKDKGQVTEMNVDPTKKS